MSDWQSSEKKQESSTIATRLSLAKRAPDKLRVLSEVFLAVFESPWIRILIAVGALYLVFLILH